MRDACRRSYRRIRMSSARSTCRGPTSCPSRSGCSAEPSTAAAPAGGKPAAAGAGGMTLVGNADKDGTTNSDLAFWGDLAYAGQLRRLPDPRRRRPTSRRRSSDSRLQRAAERRLRARDGRQAVPLPVGRYGTDAPRIARAPTRRSSTAAVSATRACASSTSRTRRSRKFIDMIQTACGSHTHSIIPRRQAGLHLRRLVSARANITPPGSTAPNGDFRACDVPHKKISIIKVSAPGGNFKFELKEQPLSDDTTRSTAASRPATTCSSSWPRRPALASCAGDAQLWDISDPWNPTSNVDGKHTHIHSPSATDQFEFIHSGVVSWDGKTFAIMDETGGGVDGATASATRRRTASTTSTTW